MLAPGVLDIVVRSDTGRVRQHNEDAVFADAHLGLAILADGMGGYNAGEVASGMATTLLASRFPEVIAACSPEKLKSGGQPYVHGQIAELVLTTNAAIFNAAQCQPQYAGMGTTLVLAWFYDNRLCVSHVGDSRLYRLRAGRLEQITRDHSILQAQIDSGLMTRDAARLSQLKNLVTRGLGVEPLVKAEFTDLDVQKEDIFLLCSDGLNDMVADTEIEETLQSAEINLAATADRLITLANEHGGRDNVSVILIKVCEQFALPRVWWQKLLAWLK
jgi:protein phosphatase